jgi:hypothetical protein
MSKPERDALQRLADETQRKLIRHMQTDTREEDARREAEREARIAALFQEWREEGNLPGLAGGEE